MSGKELVFSVKDSLDGEDITPDHISVSVLEEYTRQVAAFVRGSGRVDLSKVTARIVKGSFAVVIEDETEALEDVFSDYQKLRQGDLEDVDKRRVDIFMEWQEAARKNENRMYELFDKSSDSFVRIDSQSNYVRPESVWVEVDEYLYGKVFDVGGKSRANVHVQLGNGRSLKIGADTDFLTSDKKNRLYRKELVHIHAKKNIRTGQLRDERLVGFEEYSPHYNDEEFDELVKAGTKAWADVKSPSAWVEEMRGNG